VYSCRIVYRTLLFDIDIIHYHSLSVWLQVHRNRLGDECRSPSRYEIFPTQRHDFIAFWRQLHTLWNILVFCSATSEALRSTWKYSESTWEAHRFAFSLFGSFWKLLEGSVWLFRLAELSSYDFQNILPFADAVKTMYMNNNSHIALWLTSKQGQQLLLLHWCSFSRWYRERFAYSFSHEGGQYFLHGWQQPIAPLITQDTRPTIIDALETLIFSMGKDACLCLFWWLTWPIHPEQTLLCKFQHFAMSSSIFKWDDT